MATSTKSRPAASKEKSGTKPTASRPAKGGLVTQLYRRFAKDTSGTYRFEAVDSKGSPLSQEDRDAHVTQLYVRKSSKAMSSDPRYLRVTIEELSALPKPEKAAKESPAAEEDE